MLDARTVLIDWAARSLAHELNEPPPLCEERAESLVAIAEHYGIADEALIEWIHAPAPEKEWSAAEWRAWCEKFVAARNSEKETDETAAR